MSEKENPWNAYFHQMNEEEAKAKIEYAKLIEEDKDKSFMDILPAEFRNFKRSLIKKDILTAIDSAHEYLNECNLYDGRVFNKKEIVRYMITGTKYTKFYLAYLFIPRKDFFHDVRFGNPDFKKLSKIEQDKIEKPYNELSYRLQWLTQCWEAYEQRLNIRAGKMAHNSDKEENGIPRTSRGNMCSVYTAVKGKWVKDLSGTITLFNPRSKKKVNFTIEQYAKNDDIYVCSDSNGKKHYLSSHESVSDAWSALFAVNKEIFSGWWNKTLIWK